MADEPGMEGIREERVAANIIRRKRWSVGWMVGSITSAKKVKRRGWRWADLNIWSEV